MKAVVQSLLSHPSLLSIEWADGRRSDFPALWLRDNCPEDRDPSNHQRLIDVADLPEEPRIASAQAHGDGRRRKTPGYGRQVVWHHLRCQPRWTWRMLGTARRRTRKPTGCSAAARARTGR